MSAVTFGSLKIVDFKAIGRAQIDLRDRGLVLVTGENEDSDAAVSIGSGKTTLFEAISWVLFGEVAVHGKLGDRVIRDGAAHAEVEITFYEGERVYVATRKRTRKASSLTLTVNGAAQNGRTQADTQAFIIGVIGLDWDAFRNTVLYGQNDNHRFADRDTTDADRKAILKRILNLERFDVALEHVRVARREIRGRQDTARAAHSLATGAARSTATFLERLVADRDAWAGRWSARVEEAQRALDAHEVSTKEARLLAAQVPRLERLEAEYVVELGAAEDRHRVMIEKAAHLRRIDDSMIYITRDRNAAEKHHRAAIKRLEAFDATEIDQACPTCGRPFEEDDEHAIEAMKKRDADRVELAEAVVVAELALREAEAQAKTAAVEHDAASTASFEARAAVDADRSIQEAIAKVRTMLRDARNADRLVHEADVIAATLDERLSAIEREENPFTSRVGDAERDEAEARSVLEKAALVLEDLAAEDVPLAFWEQGFGNRGLPSFAIESILPVVNAAAARYLEVLADGDITVELVATRELKSGETRESIDLKLTIEGVVDSIPSGGQWRKIGLAVDLALMDLVAGREGSRVNMLLLDEVLDGLDAEGKSRVVTLLRALRERRGTIMVVSHDQEVAESFERFITVRKSDGVASVVEW